MMKHVLVALLSFFAVPAFAQPIESATPPECRLLPEHKPNADVTYQPGVDVKGRNVVPADMNAPVTPIGRETIIVPLTVDLAERMQGLNIPGMKMEGSLGYLEIHPDGRVSHDGQDWTSQVYVLCGKSAVSSGGQEAANVINSHTNHTETIQENHEPTGAETAD